MQSNNLIFSYDMSKQFTAIAHPNIALIKYWGKRDSKLNLPAVGSISITLRDLFTKTSVEFDDQLTQDEMTLAGKLPDASDIKRVTEFLDLVRAQAKTTTFAHVISETNFPAQAGLASSASGFAALALASTRAAGLKLSKNELSILARRGSGSAARSLYGGFVEMKRGNTDDGIHDIAVQIHDEHYWPLDILVLITSEEKKSISSRDGMNLTRDTSPYYSAWVSSIDQDLRDMRNALAQKDFETVGEISEFNCLKMHSLIFSARPGIIYWNETTLALIQKIRELRSNGLSVFFTVDAGPQVKAICLPNHADRIERGLRTIPGIKKIIKTKLGPGAYLEHKNTALCPPAI